MTVIALSTNPAIKTWEQSTTLDAADPTLGMKPIAAVAYLFGRVLRTAPFDTSAFGLLRREDAVWTFPSGSGNQVTLTDIAEALRYKYGIDPLIEFSAGIGLNCYSVADVNEILAGLNREFAHDFALAPAALAPVVVPPAVVVTPPVVVTPAVGLPALATYLGDVDTKAKALQAFYQARLADAQLRLARYEQENLAGWDVPGYSTPPLTGAINLVTARIAKYQTWLAEIGDGLQTLSTLRDGAALGLGDFTTTLLAAERAQTDPARRDVMQWLRRFDVPATLPTSASDPATVDALWSAYQFGGTATDRTQTIPVPYFRLVINQEFSWDSAVGWLTAADGLTNSFRATVAGLEGGGVFDAFDWQQWQDGTNLSSKAPFTVSAALQGAATGYSDAALLEAAMPAATKAVSIYLGGVEAHATALQAFYQDRLADAQLRLARYNQENTAGWVIQGFSYPSLTAAIDLVTAQIAKYQGWLAEIGDGLQTLASLRHGAALGLGDFTTALKAAERAQTDPARRDVMQWLRSFDVPATLASSASDASTVDTLWSAYQFGGTATDRTQTIQVPSFGGALVPRQFSWDTAVGWPTISGSGGSLTAGFRATVAGLEGSGVFDAFDWQQWKDGTNLSSKAPFTLSAALQGAATGYSDAALLEASIPAATRPIATYLRSVNTQALALQAFYQARLADAELRLQRYETDNTAAWSVSGFITTPLTAAIGLVKDQIAQYRAWLGEIGAGLQTLSSLRDGADLGLADFTAALKSAEQAQTDPARRDVMQWLRSFDVPAAVPAEPGSSTAVATLWAAYAFGGTAADPTTPVSYAINPRETRTRLIHWNSSMIAQRGDPAFFSDSFETSFRSSAAGLESAGAFAAFDWQQWKDGTNLSSQAPFTVGAALQGAAPGFSDAGIFAVARGATRTGLAPATSVELRRDLTEGGDIYTDRFGAFYINGVRTKAMDLAITSRLLAQDNMSAEYKTLMDGLSERNNLITAARTVLSAGKAGLAAAVSSLAQQYGMADVLSQLTAGEYSDVQMPTTSISTDIANASIRFNADPGWLKGTPVVVSNSGGGLTAGQVYYVRPDGTGGYSFYNTLANANSTGSTGRIDPSSSIEAVVSRPALISSGRTPVTVAGAYSVAPDGVYTDRNSFYYQGYGEFSWPGTFLPTGESVTPDRDVFNDYIAETNYGATKTSTAKVVMQAGSSFYLRRLSNGNYEIFDTADNARGSGIAGKQYFNKSIEGALRMDLISAAQYNPDPMWANGTAVRATATSGGLTAGVDYYVRSNGPGSYSFFDTEAAAAAAATTDYAVGIRQLSDPVRVSVTAVAELNRIDDASYTALTALLNTLISNKTRDGDLDQTKLQTLTAQLQNNTEAMTALIKAFSDMNSALAQALR